MANTKILQELGLPKNLIDLLRTGKLSEAIQTEYTRLDNLNAMLDEWEKLNPVQYKLCPWYEAREAWKAAGRPRPEWWQVLYEADKKKAPISVHQITNQILGTASTDHWERVKADPERYERVTRMRRVYGPRKKS